ncbi:MAG TPA: MFS transporter [Flavobacteriales bacterium]
MQLRNERILLFTLAAIQFTNIVDFMIMMPMGDILQKKLEITPAQYGFLVSSYGIAAFVTAFLGVFYLDRVDRKKALLFAYAGFIIGTMSSAILPNTDNQPLNYYLFIFTRVITGLTGGLMGGQVLAIIGDVIPLERRGRAMGVITIAFSLASILGMPVALTMVDMFDNNWHVPFIGVSLLSVPFLFLAFKFIPSITAHIRPKSERFDKFETIRLAFTNREQRSALLFTVLLVLGQFTVISFLTPYYINNVGLAQTDIKWIYLVGGASTVLTGRIIGRWVDTYGRFRMFTIAAWCSMACIFCVTHLPPVSLGVVLIFAGLFFVFVSGRMIPANTITTTVVSPQHRGGFMSLNSAMMSLGSGSSSIIAGLIVSQPAEHAPLEHYDVVGYVAIGSTLLALLVVRLLKRLSEEKVAEAAKIVKNAATHLVPQNPEKLPQ